MGGFVGHLRVHAVSFLRSGLFEGPERGMRRRRAEREAMGTGVGCEHSAVIEEVRDDGEGVAWSFRCGRRRGIGIVAGIVSGARLATTRVRDGGGGGRWMRAR